MVGRASLYVHVPFCARVCPYCAFNVTASSDGPRIDLYLDALDREISSLPGAATLEIETVYVGGGTPALLDPARLARLLGSIARRCEASFVAEWTVESNPETMDEERAAVLKASGVTRVSLGAQSFDPRFLESLGRNHGATDIERAIDVLEGAGIDDRNVDLIYGVPGQTLDAWERDVERLLGLGIDHASLYELTYEPGTPFGRRHARGEMAAADDRLAVAMFRRAAAMLRAGGIEWYEVSNFARPGRESLHNQVYWRNEPYFGVGPGAFGCDGAERTTNATSLDAWADRVFSTGTGIAVREPLSPFNTYVETLSSGLRTRMGVDLDVLAARTGIDARRAHGAVLDDLVARGFAEVVGSRVALTIEGVLLLDSILERFLDLPDAAARPAAR